MWIVREPKWRKTLTPPHLSGTRGIVNKNGGSSYYRPGKSLFPKHTYCYEIGTVRTTRHLRGRTM